jgi:potassium-transporting ATPase KdpC subunit
MKDLLALTRHALAGLRVIILLTLVLGLAYPLVLTGIAQVALPWRSNGSLVTASGDHTTDPGQAVGSTLVGQVADVPGLFAGRPSVSDTDMLATGGSNLGPESPDLLAAIEERRAEVAAREGVPGSAVPPDALTASASGLDPDISPAYAALQIPRVARETGLSEAEVARLVREHTTGRGLGVLGEPRVNVLLLNLAVREAAGA